ncbi:MAG: Ig-like domain-containing protein, partial [Bifidobacteriaceae bacterium]|nr:Ig-like domain-containing protein [Bifidobacteriaceae bacterium]
QTQVIRARVFDAAGNPVADGTEVTFSVAAGAEPTGQQIRTTVGGVAEFAVTSRQLGTYTVKARVGGEQILLVKDAAETTTTATNGQARAVFIVPPTLGYSVVLTVPTAAGGATKLADGVEVHRAQVLVKNKQGTPEAGHEVVFTYGLDWANPSTATATTGADGVAYVEFTSTVAGTFAVSAYLNGLEAEGSPQPAVFRAA